MRAPRWSDLGSCMSMASTEAVFHAQVNKLAHVLRRYGGAVWAPLRVLSGRSVEAQMDRHRPMETPYRAPKLQFQERFERAIEHAQFRRRRRSAVPLEKVHPKVEIERPVGLICRRASVEPQMPPR